MKILLLLLPLSFALFFPHYPLYAKNKKPKNIAAIFFAIQNQHQKKLPDSFYCQLTSVLITQQLKNIPDDMKELGKTPELFIEFKKGTAPTLTLFYVSPFYKNYFSPHEELLSRSGLFIGVDYFKTFRKFEKEYQVKLLAWEYDYKLKIFERDGLNDEYAFYVFDSTWELKKASFFSENHLGADLKFFYQPLKDTKKSGKTKEYQIPKKIVAHLYKDPFAKEKELQDFTIFFKACAVGKLKKP